MQIDRILKSAVRRTLRPFGLELNRLGGLGKDPLEDVRLLSGGVADVIFDVGANEGQTTERLREIFPGAAIHCFEPGADAFAALARKLGNGTNFHLVQKALGEREGVAVFHENSASVTNSLLPNAPGAEAFQPQGKSTLVRQSEVEVETLDGYCARAGIASIDLLKIDSQGFELQILRGAAETLLNARVSFILLEVLFDELYSGQAFFDGVYEFLHKHRYRFAGLYDVVRAEDGHLSWCDALFLSPRAGPGR